MTDVPRTDPDPVVEAYKMDIDRTLIRVSKRYWPRWGNTAFAPNAPRGVPEIWGL